MNASFPAVIKELTVSAGGIIMILDITTPEVALLADLVDQEVTITISPTPVISDQAPVAAAPQPADEKLPFEPDDEPVPPTTKRPHGKKSGR